MIEHRRTYFNTHFTIDAYQNMLNEIEHEFPNELDFRLAETPVFIDKKMGNQMKEACEFIIDFINYFIQKNTILAFINIFYFLMNLQRVYPLNKDFHFFLLF